MGLTFRLGQLPTSLFTDASNNVGIGAAPSGSYKLEVTGTAKVSSTLLVSGAATFSSSVAAGGMLTANVGTGATFRAAFDSTNILEVTNYSATSGYQGLQIIGSPIKFYTGTAGTGSATLALTIATNQAATFSSSISSTISIQNGSTYIISSSTGTAISSMSSGIITIRDQSNGGGCLVFYENAQTPIIISQVGATVFTTSSPSASQIQLTSSGGGGGITALGGSSRNNAQIVVATFKNS
jgi:hypothetical protein